MSLPRLRPTCSTGPIVGFITTSQETEVQKRLRVNVPTMKEKMMGTASFEQFQAAVYAKPMLRDDWLEFTSRPWVQGPIDTFFANSHLAAVTAANPLLEAAVDSFIMAGDKALQEGGHVPWLLHAVQQVAGHPGVYITAEAVEAMLGPHHAARLEALTTAALTRPRAVKVVAVLASLLTPEAIHGLMALLQACFTDERINRIMDAAEFVLSDRQRLKHADVALEQLSNAVTDDAILRLIATLDAEADLELLLSTGRQLLGWLLEQPEAMGRALGEVIDDVADMERLQRAVARNDEVMTLDRILKMHKVLTQLSPAASPANISAAASAARSALASGRLQQLAGLISAAASSVTLTEARGWWSTFDRALTPAVVVSLLHLTESLLDGGRIWALLGQPQPMLEMLLNAAAAADGGVMARARAAVEVPLTQLKLNVSLAGDVLGLWWAFHVAVAPRMRF
ncbi:hypothetical protein OEZ86_006629 [Tetradesmus obliquus]|nr:hypothetical protein OEZ86_006629 [Tetradesmus obliquus]